MSRKPAKGYFVRGQFVAEGSELDLELKRELKGSVDMSKTDLKKHSDQLQALGEGLLTLGGSLMAALLDAHQLPEKLLDAVAEAKRISNFEGRRRQMQYIGKLMRRLDPSAVAAIEAALQEQHKPSALATLALHQAEQWRDRLLADDAALTHWLEIDPQADAQQLRALIRQARKDVQTAPAQQHAGAALRHGKAYRDIFQLVKASLAQDSADASAAFVAHEDHLP
ncbi:ribosome biogenesis factor YjgA [Hydrogenophaga sp.]|uniref:ribosome biogenesis factor YjgA n=1 Tax=Hydrogenophaga sp. TaxID=1904254 RepID=UPI0019925BCA|nr:ribosome biogenesis factor YjgA [Hydrogenophaga sp.]MBD3893216.1 DUF615 domain-containing protein [Hydrogenophaga sp.]